MHFNVQTSNINSNLKYSFQKSHQNLLPTISTFLGKLDIRNKRIKLDPYFKPLIKINLKEIKDLSVIPETIKLFKRKWKQFFHMGLSNDLLTMTPKTHAAKAKIKKGDYNKQKKLHGKRKN